MVPRQSRVRALSLALYKQKQYDEACALFEQPTKTEPEDASLWSDAGRCLIPRAPSAGENALKAEFKAWKLASTPPEKVRTPSVAEWSST